MTIEHVCELYSVTSHLTAPAFTERCVSSSGGGHIFNSTFLGLRDTWTQALESPAQQLAYMRARFRSALSYCTREN